MKNIYITIVLEEGGKRAAFSDTIHAGQNLKSIIERYKNADIIHLCETARQAGYLAAEWNAAYRQKGCWLYD